jgi:AP-1 complex subunit gamma-1|mmetsp:Transcript_5979/g.18806  ORF Transcript_5979/g.18806 Transcript_5979/m.18806 type:complete len:512 (+) Transcript_5979:1051-2586(+)
MMVKSETGLQILAINILGRFLLNRDNNIRYVALSSLSNVVNEDVAAVQRHRSTILDCLKDPDVSIRQRAFELTYQLVDANNVVVLVREMLNYLVVAPPEHRNLLCSRVSTVIDKFAPSPKWHAETLIAMLSIAGNHCDSSIACATVNHLALSEALHGYATHKLFRLLQSDLPRVQIALMHVAIWCIGEFGPHLLEHCSFDDTHEIYEAVPLSDIIGLLEAVTKSHLATTLTRCCVLTALMKLACRLQRGQGVCRGLVESFVTSLSLELQQRSCEYVSLFDEQWATLQQQALARMPVSHVFRSEIQGKGSILFETSKEPYVPGTDQGSTGSTGLFDILDGSPTATGGASGCRSINDVDLLSDIFSGNAAAPGQTTDAMESHLTPNPEQSGSNSQQIRADFMAFEKDGLRLTMGLVKEAAGADMNITCSFSNSTASDFAQLIFQAAVPKYISMEWEPASASTVPANNLGAVTQVIKVKNTATSKPLMMRLKIQYTVGNRHIIEQTQISSFPIQ